MNSEPSAPVAVEFFWDPMCPFAWVTSRWIVEVDKVRPLEIDWRFISLRILNEGKNYETDFPRGYDALHTKGLRQLRVAAAVRAEIGRAAMGPLYTAFGTSIWDRDPVPGGDSFAMVATPEHLVAVLRAAGLPERFAAAADDDAFDEVLRAETADALTRAGKDLGTPLIAVSPPGGPAFFGPVISRIPTGDEAVALWDAVMTLATWPGFAELKRSLREMPPLRVYSS